MRQHLAFLHTSPVHIETFERLVKAAAPGLHVEHIVAEELLTDAQKSGLSDSALVARIQAEMTAAAASGAAMVVCTCSTIGGAAEKTPTGGRFIVIRIDRAMADRAVRLGSRILVLAALESTLQPTTELLQESATALGIEAGIRHHLIPGAWRHFTHGHHAAYKEAIVCAARSAVANADVIVLAQASMAIAMDDLRDVGVEVLSSPGIGLQSILARLNA